MNKLKFLFLLCLSLTISIAVNAQNGNKEELTIVQTDTIQVHSTVMNKNIKTVVIVPTEYKDNDLQDQQYPVLYLLHGAGGNYSDWSRKKDNIEDLSSQYGIIIVCPDGADSWYWDSPVNKGSQYETYITKELIPYIDKTYRTLPQNKYRAIAGLSMGGQGALWLAFHHPDIFCAVGSMSGGVDITKFPDRWNINNQLGSYESNKDVWQAYSIMSLIPSLQNGQLKIIFDCGSSDFFFDVNNKLHQALLEKGIDHDYIVRPGKHNWPYWNNSLDYQMLFFSKAFEEGNAQ